MLQHYWNLTIRFFNALSRTLIGVREFYSSAEMQLVYSTAPADWTRILSDEFWQLCNIKNNLCCKHLKSTNLFTSFTHKKKDLTNLPRIRLQMQKCYLSTGMPTLPKQCAEKLAWLLNFRLNNFQNRNNSMDPNNLILVEQFPANGHDYNSDIKIHNHRKNEKGKKHKSNNWNLKKKDKWIKSLKPNEPFGFNMKLNKPTWKEWKFHYHKHLFKQINQRIIRCWLENYTKKST